MSAPHPAPSATAQLRKVAASSEASLQWGTVEEYKADTDSVSSSRRSSDESLDDIAEGPEGEEDDGWGWFNNDDNEDEPKPAPPVVKLARSGSVDGVREPPGAAAAKPKSTRPLVRPVSQTQLEPMETTPKLGTSTGGGASLLLLGSEQWPTKSSKPAKQAPRVKVLSLLGELLDDAKAKHLSLVSSSMIVLGRGFGLGFLLRALPVFLHDRTLITRDAVRTGLFLGLSMSFYHVMAMSDDQKRHHLGVAALLTPLLGLLSRESRSSVAWFVSARVLEAAVFGVLKALPKPLQDNIPLSKWIFALGNAQILYLWLFHADAMPVDLVRFIDSVSAFRSTDVAATLAGHGDPSKIQSAVYHGGRLAPGLARDLVLAVVRAARSLLGLVVSDVFSAASLLGPLIGRGLLHVAKLCLVLGADVAFSGFALVALTRALRRALPTDAWVGGLFAGLAAAHLEPSEATRVELGLYLCTNALRALAHLAQQRKILPSGGFAVPFVVYFAGLQALLGAAETPGSRLVIGRAFKEVLRKSLVV